MILEYFYPLYNPYDSFSIVAKHHISALRKVITVYEISNTAKINYTFTNKEIVAFQPWLYVADRYIGRISNAKRVICVDVADSDEFSANAVTRLQFCDRIIVPSRYNVEIFSRYFDKDMIFYVPHGVEDEFLKPGKILSREFDPIYRLKREKGTIVLGTWVTHSEWRKGMDIVLAIYRSLKKMKKNVFLFVKSREKEPSYYTELMSLGGAINSGFIPTEQKVAWYDSLDLYILGSRGGGFEITGLEAMSRGVPVIAADKGPWVEYLPPFSLLPSRRSEQVLPGNPFHVGKGWEIDVNKAIDRIVDIVDNIDEYKKLTVEWWLSMRDRYIWQNNEERIRNAYLGDIP